MTPSVRILSALLAAALLSSSTVTCVPFQSHESRDVYDSAAVLSDLRRLQAWAGDKGSLTKKQEKETVAAILSAGARYYPELPTQVISRVIISDILAESDFQADMVSGGRLDSGSSYGLMQVSPHDGGQELALFQEHATTTVNRLQFLADTEYSRAADACISGSGNTTIGPISSGMGKLTTNYNKSSRLKSANLNDDSLFRPWVNIHVASFIQSNLARGASMDPYDWKAAAQAERALQAAAAALVASANADEGAQEKKTSTSKGSESGKKSQSSKSKSSKSTKTKSAKHKSTSSSKKHKSTFAKSHKSTSHKSTSVGKSKSHGKDDENSKSGEKSISSSSSSAEERSLVERKTRKASASTTGTPSSDSVNAYYNAQSKYQDAFEGAGLPRTLKTALGSWVAGPGADDGGFQTDGDDISEDYLGRITDALSYLYGTDIDSDWLDSWSLTAGLVDYRG